jgi:drug/metabolite transporter (DMT)-like permease
MSPYLFALLSNFSWGLGTQFYTFYSKKISPVWTNIFKGTLACILFGLTVMLTGGFGVIQPKAIFLFMLSGFIGLGFADILFFKAFSVIGSSRTIIIVSFETVIVGILSYYFFGQSISAVKLLSIIFLLGCVFIFALENYKKTAKWQWQVFFIALGGVFLDALGVIATRMAFNISGVSSLEANTYRSLGAVAAFVIIAPVFKVRFFERLSRISLRAKTVIFLGTIIGTYLCLLFHLAALKTGHLATISAMSCTAVIFAAAFECLLEKKRPSKYLMAAFGLFLCAIGLLFG